MNSEERYKDINDYRSNTHLKAIKTGTSFRLVFSVVSFKSQTVHPLKEFFHLRLDKMYYREINYKLQI